CHLRDARLAVGLDTTLADLAGFRDLQKHESELRRYVLARIEMTGDSLPCPVTLAADSMKWKPEVHSVALHVVADCPHPPVRLGIHEEILFDRDSTHRAYFLVRDARTTSVGVLRVHDRSAAFPVKQFHFGEALVEFTIDGVREVPHALELLLLLVALLLPAPLLRQGGDWIRRETFADTRGAAVPAVAALSAGLLLTLALSYSGALRLPEVVVQAAAAAAVFLAAWNNLRPFLRRTTLGAFVLGLAVGPKPAGDLMNLLVPHRGRTLAVAAFGAGLEIAVILTAAVALPVFFALAQRRAYPRWIMGLASLAIAWVAVIWTLERAFALSLFARH